jgi:hypothetical protein
VYVLAALWGVADAIWQTQITSLYGVLFAKNEEAAFSNYKLWESTGYLFSFISQDSGDDSWEKQRQSIIVCVPKNNLREGHLWQLCLYLRPLSC